MITVPEAAKKLGKDPRLSAVGLEAEDYRHVASERST